VDKVRIFMNSDPGQYNGRHQLELSQNHQPDKHHRPVTEPHANAATNGHATVAGTSIFGLYAPLLLRNGYSPVPIEPGCKRPLAAVGDWNRLRVTPLTDDEIVAIGTEYPNAGLGVLGGYRGLVPIDIDTEDADIQAAIDAVLPDYLVAKRGRRGATVFFRDPSGLIKPRKFKKADGSMIMEVLTTGQVVIPPTMHPETQLPYRWLTEYTLLQVHIDELPEL
jgi:Bifunctional DNA primase/polymerase, N-terminal